MVIVAPEQTSRGKLDMNTIAAPAPTLLAKIGNQTLVHSAQGFLLVYRGLAWPEIVRQLHNFDAGNGIWVSNRCSARHLQGWTKNRCSTPLIYWR
jgi:hypothetical protein